MEKTDEQILEEDTAKYLKGEITEDKEPESVEEDSVVEEEVPKEEGPAIKENKRLREKNREINDQMQALQEQIDKLAAAQAPKEESKSTPQAKLKAATMDELLDTEASFDEQMLQAHADGDHDLVKRIVNAKKQLRAEMLERPARNMKVADEDAEAKAQFEKLEKDIMEAVPDIKDKSSAIYKAAQKYADENTALMKKLGNAGGLFAIVQALTLSKSTTKKEKAAVSDIVDQMEKIAESSVPASGSTSGSQKPSPIRYEDLSDDEFEAEYQKMKSGQRPVPKTG